MPRRPAIRTLALYAAALTAATAFAPPPVLAQLASPTDSVLLKPVLDGDPKNPPRFQRTANGVAVQSGDDTGTLGTSPGSGAGTTGFLSVPGKGKSKKSPKAKPANGAAASAPINAPDSPVTPIVKVTPIGAAKLPQNRTRPGAPVRAMVPALATDPDLAPELLPAPPPRPTPPPGQLPIPQSPTVSPLPDEHPFAPTGIVAGAFRLRPALEVTGGYDTNPSRSSPNAIPSAATTTLGGSPTYIVAPELLVNSMWSRHELTAAIHGSYTGYTRFSSLNRPNFDAKVDGRIDVTSLTHINLESRYLVYTDNPGSPNIPAGLSRYPLAQDWGATAGIDQQFNRFQVTLKGLADRTIYQNSDFTDGEVSSNKDRNFNQYQLQLRGGYEVTPGIKPFAEVDADTRIHDLEVDKFGEQRDSVGGNIKVGSGFELSRTLIGEASLGYLVRNYKDPTLPNLSGMLVNGSLSWLATALTTVKFTAATTGNETTLAGVSGIFTREIGVEVDHEFRRWLVATAKFTHALDVYVGSPRRDVRYVASAALTYMLTREWQLKGEVRREWRTSNQPGDGYVANIALFGIRLQR